MFRSILLACVPYFAALIVGIALLRWFAGRFRMRLDFNRLGAIVRDQQGTVQSLSLVLTLPFFVLILLFIVQVAQLMAATIVVHYAAFAAARAAIVWIPARVDPYFEAENRINVYALDPHAPDQQLPELDPSSPLYGPSAGGLTFIVLPGSTKYAKIASAAVLACAAISPSARMPLPGPDTTGPTAAILEEVYRAMVPTSQANPRTSERLRNKLAYAAQATRVEIRFYHPNFEPPLVTYWLGPDPGEFYPNELGWQDPITVTVEYWLPLMPGPGRLLARPTPTGPGGGDSISPRVSTIPGSGVYVYPITATITLGNEGLKPVYPYREIVW